MFMFCTNFRSVVKVYSVFCGQHMSTLCMGENMSRPLQPVSVGAGIICHLVLQPVSGEGDYYFNLLFLGCHICCSILFLAY